MKALHQEYKNLANGCQSPKEFVSNIKKNGFEPSKKLQDTLNRPVINFKDVLSSMNNFKRPTEQERIQNKTISNFGRYKRGKRNNEGVSSNKDVELLQRYHRGEIDQDMLKSNLPANKIA